MATRKAQAPKVGTSSATPPKETRAQRSERLRTEHAAREAAKAAAREAAKAAKAATKTAPIETMLASPTGTAEPIAASPDEASRARVAHTHTGAREGVVLSEDEFAGLMDAPVPFDTPATARYRGLPHEATPATEAHVTALRYAGQDDEEIALYLQVSMETLYRCYRVTLVEAHAKMSGALAIRLAQMGLAGDFKTTKFLAEKRLRGFGAPDKPFVVVRDREGLETARNYMGQSAAAIANRRRTVEPEPDADGIIDMEMVLGVPERPLSADGYELSDEEIAAQAREAGLA